MRIVFIADTHGLTDLEIPECDVLVHAGDITRTGHIDEVQRMAAWLGSQPARTKIAIAGNHDRAFAVAPTRAQGIMAKEGITYLEDSGTEVDGVSFWGTPWTPTFGSWSFMEDEAELAERWASIPEVDVLISHGPPRGVHDMTSRGVRAGSFAMLDVLQRASARIIACGHIHESHGWCRLPNGTWVINASCGPLWGYTRGAERGRPVVFDLKVEA